MKFYLIEIATGDAKIAGKAIYEYASRNEAVAKYHSRLGSAMASELYLTDLVMVIDEIGNVIESTYYDSNLSYN